nr:MAG TPA: hypothetical protein [Caudoviricetes sp.]
MRTQSIQIIKIIQKNSHSGITQSGYLCRI